MFSLDFKIFQVNFELLYFDIIDFAIIFYCEYNYMNRPLFGLISSCSVLTRFHYNPTAQPPPMFGSYDKYTPLILHTVGVYALRGEGRRASFSGGKDYF